MQTNRTRSTSLLAVRSHHLGKHKITGTVRMYDRISVLYFVPRRCCLDIRTAWARMSRSNQVNPMHLDLFDVFVPPWLCLPLKYV